MSKVSTVSALSTLNPYIWNYKKYLFAGLIFVLISNLFGIYPPQIIRSAIDMVEDMLLLYRLHQGFEISATLKMMIANSLFFYAGLVILMALFRGIFLFFTRQTLIVMSRLVEYDLRNHIYDHYQSLSLSFFRKNKTGDLMARITEDVNRVRMYLGPGIMYTFNTITLTIIVVITMFMVNPELTLYSIIPLPILSVSIYYLESFILDKSDKIQKQLSRLTTFTQEIFSGIRVVKAYAREEDTNSKFAEESQEYMNKSMQLVKLNALFFPLVMLLVGLSTILVVWVGGGQVIMGKLSIGNIAEFLLYINMLTWPIIAIGWVTTLIQRAGASQDRINEMLNQHSEIIFPTEGPEIKKANLVFENVSFTYKDTGINALDGVSFELNAGEKLGILGPTGCGKSTLCNHIPRMLERDSGNIIIDGKRIEEYSRSALRESIGYAPQEVFLFSATIKENIAFGVPGASDEAVKDAARKAGIFDNIMSFQDQFDTMVGERGVTLSGGQKQRIALARAWIRNPKFLILDDSLSAVDTSTEERILYGLKQAREEDPDMAVIMVSHRISTIQDADRIIVVQEGKITESGDHLQLLSKNGYYASIYQKQLIEAEMDQAD